MVARIEAEVVGVAGKAPVGRTAPIVAVRTTIAERRPPPTGSREKDVVAVALARYFAAVNSIHCCPFPGAIVH